MSDRFHSLRKAANFISRFQPDEDACLQLADDLQWAADEIELLRSVLRGLDNEVYFELDDTEILIDGWIKITKEQAAAIRRALESTP